MSIHIRKISKHISRLALSIPFHLYNLLSFHPPTNKPLPLHHQLAHLLPRTQQQPPTFHSRLLTTRCSVGLYILNQGQAKGGVLRVESDYLGGEVLVVV